MSTAESLLTLAARDLSHARDNVRKHPSHAAFSLQQAAEKMIKALLETEGVDYPFRSHQLAELVSRVPDGNPFKADLIQLTHLTSAATRYRYPTPSDDVPAEPSAEELQRDLAVLLALLPEIRDWLHERRTLRS